MFSVPQALEMRDHTVPSSVLLIGNLVFKKKNKKGREVKGRGERERYTHWNAEFQRIARRDKKPFLSERCKDVVFLHLFALITEESFLICPCYSLELCIQMRISPFLLCFSLLFFSQLFVRPPQTAILPFCISFSWDGLDPCLLYNVTNLRP